MEGMKRSIGFNQGVAYAVSELIRQGDMIAARDIWETSGCTLKGVDVYDADPIRSSKRNGWISCDWSAASWE